MKTKHLKLTGLVLMLAGIAGVGITAIAMQDIYQAGAGSSAPALAEAVSGSMLPASIGTILTLAGLVLLGLGWWRGRGTKQRPVLSA